jgi:ABC-type oligopeptide transport system substrate-binding subunit
VFEDTRKYLQVQWQESLGVEMTWQMVDLALFRKAQREQPCLFLGLWVADYPDPNNFLNQAAPEILRRWGNEAYEQMVAEASRITDQAERMELYKEADRMLMEEAVIMPLIYGRRYRLVKPWVSRYPVSPMHGWWWKDVVIEPH